MWTEDVVGRLVELKRAGVKRFEVAWDYAMDDFPPAPRLGVAGQLQIPEEEPLEDFLRRRCRLEWNGECAADFGGMAGMLVRVGMEGARRRGGHQMVA